MNGLLLAGGAAKRRSGRWSAVRGLGLALVCLLMAAGAAHAQFQIQKPKMVLSPASFSFGLVQRGTTVTQTLTIRNTGTANLIIDSINSSDYHFGGSPRWGMTISPGSSSTVQVQAFASFSDFVAPGPDGQTYHTGALNIRSNASVAPRTVPLDMTMTGPYLIADPEGGRDAIITLDFGSQPAGSASGPFAFTLTNSGDQDTTVSGPIFSGAPGDPFWTVIPENPDWDGVLPAGQSVTFSIFVYYGGHGALDTTCDFSMTGAWTPWPTAYGMSRRLELEAYGE